MTFPRACPLATRVSAVRASSSGDAGRLHPKEHLVGCRNGGVHHLRQLRQSAPDVTLNVKHFTARDSAVDLLDGGLIDLAIGVPPTQQVSRILARPLLEDEFVTIVRRGHPRVGPRLDLKTFLGLSHVLVSPEGERYGIVDEALAKLDKKRLLAITLPHMFAVPPAVVACSDLAATLLRRVAMASGLHRRLSMFEPPLELPRVAFNLIWHRRNEGHPAQRWLREVAAKAANLAP
jgi:DNA-binding transcriptional LysR family regulator